jgi:hypothetical protein
MQFLKLDPAIPFLQKQDSIPDTVRNAARLAPYNKPSYRSERRLSVWLFAAPDMSAGAAPKFTPAWRNQHLEDFVTSRGYHIAQLGLTHKRWAVESCRTEIPPLQNQAWPSV